MLELNLDEILQEKNKTAYQLAKGIGVSITTAYDWASGRRFPSSSNISKILEFLNCPIEKLYRRIRP